MGEITGMCRLCEWSFENDDRNWEVEPEDKDYIPKSVKKMQEETEGQVYIYA